MVMRKLKTLVLFVLVFVLVGSFISPMSVSAAQSQAATGVVDATVKFVGYKGSDMKSKYWGIEAPELAGYYFGGWYATADETVAIKYSDHKNEIANDATVYAKFVPSYMLNVKVQNSADLDTRNNAWDTSPDSNKKTSIRMISAVDSTRYKEVGFHVFINGSRVSKKPESRYNETVYDQIMADGVPKTASDMFGLPGKLMIAKFINIPETGWKTSIFIRPYWITFDGIEVRGNGRYVHVEDGIKGYISVPVNIQGSSAAYAAGTLSVNYDKSRLNFVDAKTDNMILESMRTYKKQDGTINCAAVQKATKSIKNVTPNLYAAILKDSNSAMYNYENVNNMYVTLRFQAKSGADLSNPLIFNIKNMDFCNRDEQAVTVNVWDVKY